MVSSLNILITKVIKILTRIIKFEYKVWLFWLIFGLINKSLTTDSKRNIGLQRCTKFNPAHFGIRIYHI